MEWLSNWLADYYLSTTLLMLLAACGIRLTRQPARRVAIVWGSSLGLLVLVVLCALPAWPRFSLPQQLVEVAATKPAVQEGRPHDDFPADPRLRSLSSGTKSPSQREPLAAKIPIETAGGRLAPDPTTESGLDAGAAGYIETEESQPARAGALAGLLRRAGSLLENQRLRSFASAGFLIGFALHAFRVVLGVARASVMCRAATSPPSHVVEELMRIVGPGRRRPRLLMCDSHPVPLASGAVRPTILLPWAFAEDDRANDCRAVLAHEWAHIRNGDLWLLVIDRWLLPLLWANPLYWRLRRTIRNDQELLADASAARFSTPLHYAEMLLSCAKKLAVDDAPKTSAALGVWESPSRLADRIQTLLHHGALVEVRCSRGWCVGCLALLATAPLVLSTASIRPASAVSPDRGAPPSQEFSPTTRVRNLPSDAVEGSADKDLHSEWELEQPAIAEIRRLGGEVKTERIGPFRFAAEVNMVYRITPEGLRQENTLQGDEALPSIGRLRRLEALALGGAQISDEGLQHLMRLRHLRRLALWDAERLTDDGASVLGEFPELRRLEISNASALTDQAMNALCALHSLEELTVQGALFSDAAFASASRLAGLKTLLIDRGRGAVTDAAMNHFAAMTSLEHLGIQGTAVTDDGLQWLAGLRNLHLLLVDESRVSEAGVARLQEQLPGVNILSSRRTDPARWHGLPAAYCERLIRWSDHDVKLARRFVKRLRAGKLEALAEISTPSVMSRDFAEKLNRLPALDNVELGLAYADPVESLIVSSPFAGGEGKELVVVLTVCCHQGRLAVNRVELIDAQIELDSRILAFADEFPKAQAAPGWLPLKAPQALR